MRETLSAKRPSGAWLAMAVLAAVVLASGCGPETPGTVPVSGRVTYGGGDWPNGGVLYFAPKGAGRDLPGRPTGVQFQRDGKFVVKSFKEGDGLVPGVYVVTIDCWKTTSGGMGGSSVSAVPEKYRSKKTSDFIIEVKPDQSSIEIERDIPKVP